MSSGLTVPSRAGHLPLLGTPPDPSRPNLPYFDFVDQVVALASSLGITLAIVPTWGRYLTGGLAGGPIIFDEQNALEYGRFLGERYPFHPCILGGDTNRYWNKDTVAILDQGAHPDNIPLTDFAPVVEAMAQGIKEGETKAIKQYAEVLPENAKSYRTFMTYHSTQGKSHKILPS